MIKYLFPKILKFNAKISIWWKLNVFDENSALIYQDLIVLKNLFP